MNELLLELAKKAGIELSGAQFSGVLEAEVSEYDLEKFAELIIKECCQINYDNLDSYREACEINGMIKKHFGFNNEKD